MEPVFFVSFLIFGHVLGSLLVYANHRFVLHGWIGRLRMFSWARHLHAMHHKHAYPSSSGEDVYYRYYSATPTWVKISLSLIFLAVCFFSVPLGIGLSSAIVYYEIMHRNIHGRWRNTYTGRHHEAHHRRPKYNFAGVYPWIDSVFRTTEVHRSRQGRATPEND